MASFNCRSERSPGFLAEKKKRQTYWVGFQSSGTALQYAQPSLWEAYPIQLGGWMGRL